MSGGFDHEQQAWWVDLLLHGMGEYFYVNDIDYTGRDFVDRLRRRRRPGGGLRRQLGERYLVPIGGGRDTAVAVGLLRRFGLEFRTMVLQPTTVAARTIGAMADAEGVVEVRRTLDPEMLRMNQTGFLNGHTPFSAYLAFTSALCLRLFGCRPRCSPTSAAPEEATLRYRAGEINHRYPKTLASKSGSMPISAGIS